MTEYFVHDSAIVDEGVQIGGGTKIWHFSHIMSDAQIGENCTLGQNTFVGRGVNVGNNCKIQNNVSIYEGVTLEDDVFCGPSCVFTNVLNPRSEYPAGSRYAKTMVHSGVTIGANATIVCGTTLGAYAFVGAGSVVTSDVPPYSLVYGVPAVLRGWMCRCGNRLDFTNDAAVCTACGRGFTLTPPASVTPTAGPDSASA